MGKIEVEFYETEDGKCPVYEFLSSLDAKMQAKAIREIELAKKYKKDFERRNKR